MDARASTLIAGLEEKLADLDHKVAAYRQDLADEFTRHSQRLLRDLPEPLAATVQRSVALSAHKYPAISPALPPAPAPALTRADSPKPSHQHQVSATGGAATGAATGAPAAPAAGAGAGASAALLAPVATAGASTNDPPAHGPGATCTHYTATGTGAGTSTSTAATTASRPAGHEDDSSPASRLPRPATPPPPLRPPRPSSSSSPSPPAATDDLGQMSDSPDDREAGLRGVFTPTFLPLLDTSIDRMRSPPTPPRPRPSRNHLPPVAAAPMDAIDPSPVDPAEPRLSASPPTPSHLPVRPAAVRRATDDLSTSSALSDKSDSKSRRSALRRSSSSSKPQSPRRVRFEVAGTEVLPTSSPSDSSQDIRQPLSDGSYTARTLGEEEDDDDPARPRSVAAILGLADIEDDEPPPKKVSSTQALRALSRLPLDSDTVWMPVTQQESTADPDSESRGADAVQRQVPLKSETPTGSRRRPGTPPPRRPGILEAPRAKTHLGAPLQPATESWQDDDDSSDSSDDDFLSIARPKSFATKKSMASPRPKSSSGESSRPVAARRATTDAVSKPAKGPQPFTTPSTNHSKGAATQSKAAQVKGNAAATSDSAKPVEREAPPRAGPDCSDVFDFEPAEGMPARPPTPPCDESDSEPEASGPIGREPLHMYSTSPAVGIPQAPPGLKSVRAEDDATSSTPTTNVPTSASKSQTPAVGSYKGRSIMMPVVVDPSVHEQAMALGEFNSFVGGLDGRSGMDDADPSSFRASIASVPFDGTPRSFSERMMMEERMEQVREKLAAEGKGVNDGQEMR